MGKWAGAAPWELHFLSILSVAVTHEGSPPSLAADELLETPDQLSEQDHAQSAE